MFVSQPRRIAARALCERVRATHDRPGEIGLRLGHGVRDEGEEARVTFVTCGYLVRLVAHRPEILESHTHVVVRAESHHWFWGTPRTLQNSLPPSNRTRFPRFLDRSTSLPE